METNGGIVPQQAGDRVVDFDGELEHILGQAAESLHVDKYALAKALGRFMSDLGLEGGCLVEMGGDGEGKTTFALTLRDDMLLFIPFPLSEDGERDDEDFIPAGTAAVRMAKADSA